MASDMWVVTTLLMLMIPCDLTISTQSSSASSQQNCSQPLGMEDGAIRDAQITASSSYQETLVGPEKARLNTEAGGGAWCPSRVIDLDHSLEEWLEVDLGQETLVTAVVVQGRYANGLGQEYAEYYALRYWSEGSDKWEEYSGGGEEDGLVRGNNNTYQPLEHRLRPPMVTSRVRILPFSYHPRTVCMRLELKGCKVSNESEDLLLGTLDKVQPQSAEEEWTETMFLVLAASILGLVVMVTISAIIYVIVSNWKLKHYSTFYTGNDGASSLESSLKRGEEETLPSIYMSGSNTSSSFEKRSVRPNDNYTRLQYYPGGVQYIR